MSVESIRVTEAIDLSGDSRPRWRRGRQLSDGSRIYWWKEILIVLVVDVVYETVRNLSSAKPQKAYDNAIRLIDWQRDLGIWHEHGIQQWALGFTPMIIAANYFYGSVYIVATVLGLVFLYRLHSDDYPLWRNTLAIGTLLGLIGFATFPLMPPRLLDTWADPNGLFQFNADTFFHFKDTLLEYPTFWSFNSEGMKSISNQFAAMPSLHCGWAFWGLAVFYPRVKSWWAKGLAILYPITTIYVVVITGNHYFLDAVGGLFIMVVGYGGARLITRSGRGPKIVHTPSEELSTIDVSDGGPQAPPPPADPGRGRGRAAQPGSRQPGRAVPHLDGDAVGGHVAGDDLRPVDRRRSLAVVLGDDGRSSASRTMRVSWSTMSASVEASSPSRPCSTNSRMPVRALATTGSPAHRASRAAMPNDSRLAGATNTSLRPKIWRISSRLRRPTRSTTSVSPLVRRNFSSCGRSGPSPMMTTFRVTSGPRRATTRRIIFSSCSGRLRGARRITDTRVTTDGSRSTGSTTHWSLSIPLGRTMTSRSGPAMRRMGSAATLLTAESTTGHSVQCPTRSSAAKPGVA